MEKEYIENKDGKYFSGQGKVSLEKYGKIYELCTSSISIRI